MLIGFLRSIAGLIPRAVLGSGKGLPIKLKFWDQRLFSRVVKWGRDYKNASSVKSVGEWRLGQLSKAMIRLFLSI